MNKEDLALNNLQWLICHKTKTNLTKCFLIIPPEHYKQGEHKISLKWGKRQLRFHYSLTVRKDFAGERINFLS